MNPRQILRWKRRGETIELELDNQAALDTLLAATEHDEACRRTASGKPAYSQAPVGGKAMTLVEEGIYLSGPEKGSVWLELFLIDVHPTTNGDYAKFVAATRHRPPQHWPGGRCTITLATHPVVWVTWHDVTRADRRQVPHCAKFLAERRWDEREDTADGR
ncbi:hypothetical protein ACH4NT_15655 [Streptomyces lydicus]|uniref:hypothetical protein n=1 Tax=Streptomyces lydicus TaxID=47763 RepID=UPI0037BB31D3